MVFMWVTSCSIGPDPVRSSFVFLDGETCCRRQTAPVSHKFPLLRLFSRSKALLKPWGGLENQSHERGLKGRTRIEASKMAYPTWRNRFEWRSAPGSEFDAH